MRWICLVLACVSGCALNAAVPPEPPTGVVPPAQADGFAAHCAAPPNAPAEGFRHRRNAVYAALGSPRHRGHDLVAVESDENQTLTGKLAYTAADKDLGDEDVELFACVDHAWRRLGRARTDGDGRFAYPLAQRLPPGMRDLYAHVPGDGSGARFLAYVARPGEHIVISDIDGTITASEEAVFRSVLFGRDIGHQPGAPEALAASPHRVVYVSSRGEQLTGLTRAWLRTHGFPPGPLRLARASVTLPGKGTAAYKQQVLRDLRVPIAAAVGNRASDVAAYTGVGLPGDRIHIYLPEFERELRDHLAAGRATPFTAYRDLRLAAR